MITTASLREYTSKDLAQMAKKRGISGWHSMRKDELIKAIVKDAKPPRKRSTRRTTKASSKNANPAAPRSATAAKTRGGKNPIEKNGRSATKANSKVKSKSVKSNGTKAHRTKATGLNEAIREKPKKTKVSREIQRQQKLADELKDLAHECNQDQSNDLRDRVVLMVRDPFWLQASWELSPALIQRATAAMAEQWHTAIPIIRLFQVSKGSTTSTIETHVRDIEIHGGVSTWYIDVKDPPKAYRVEIGYRSANGAFHSLARSNTVATPAPGGSDAIDENWRDVAQNCVKIFALSGGYSRENENDAREIQELFEERFQRPMGAPIVSRYGAGASSFDNGRQSFHFEVDAEMIIYGAASSSSHVTLAGEPVKLRSDGTFTVRLSLPDRRQVLPVVANSGDGSQQQTIVLAVERNTKVMEPLQNDASSNV